MGSQLKFLNFSFLFSSQKPTTTTTKMSEAEAKDAFIIFDEAYEGNDVDAFYVGDSLRALGCNVTNAAVVAAGGAASLGEKRVAFADFLPILAAVKLDTSSTGCKDGEGKVPLPEVLNVLSSLGEKLEPIEAEKLVALLGLKADEEDMISYMELIDKLLAATA